MFSQVCHQRHTRMGLLCWTVRRVSRNYVHFCAVQIASSCQEEGGIILNYSLGNFKVNSILELILLIIVTFRLSVLSIHLLPFNSLYAVCLVVLIELLAVDLCKVAKCLLSLCWCYFPSALFVIFRISNRVILFFSTWIFFLSNTSNQTWHVIRTLVSLHGLLDNLFLERLIAVWAF